MRWAIWAEAVGVNEAIQTLITQMPNTHFIDTGAALISDSSPNPDNYVFDTLHLSAKGYEIRAEISRSRLCSDLDLPQAAGDVICTSPSGVSLNCILARR